MTGQADAGRREQVRVVATLLFAVFVVAVGYGIALPVWPTIVVRLAGTSDPLVIARHTALLTGIYVAAPLVVALPWAWLSVSIGRRAVMTVGLVGFAVTLAGSPIEAGLPLVYAGRLLNGAFAAAIVPAALAAIADRETEPDRRARIFSWISMASILGYLVGPMLGGLAVGLAGRLFGGGTEATGVSWPFLIATGLAIVAVVFVLACVPDGRDQARAPAIPAGRSHPERRTATLLLTLAAVAAAGLGVFEVGLTLRGGELAMTPLALGLMFALCSVAMLLVQAIVFSPIVRPPTTRWLIAPAFAAMALGLALVPRAIGLDALLAETGLVAASAGVLTPVLAYWTSLVAGASQDVAFGKQNAAISFGQALGSAGAGLLFGLNGVPHAAFLAAALVLGVAALASLRLPSGLQRLAPADHRISVTEEKISCSRAE